MKGKIKNCSCSRKCGILYNTTLNTLEEMGEATHHLKLKKLKEKLKKSISNTRGGGEVLMIYKLNGYIFLILFRSKITRILNRERIATLQEV